MGQVELNEDKNIQWKMLSSRNWSKKDADVVCRETGHKEALEVIDMRDYGRRKELDPTIFPNNDNRKTKEWERECNGSEYSILRCPGTTGRDTEEKKSGVGVRCKDDSKNFLKTSYNMYSSKI